MGSGARGWVWGWGASQGAVEGRKDLLQEREDLVGVYFDGIHHFLNYIGSVAVGEGRGDVHHCLRGRNTSL